MNMQTEGGVSAVNRALTVLLAFGNAPNGLMLAQVSEATGLNMSTLLRMFESLEQFRFIKRLPDGRYVLGPANFHLGMTYRESFQLREHAAPILARLSEETGETAAFYVREGDQRVCLFRFHAERSVRTNLREGDRFPLDVGAAGHVLLAFSGTRSAEHEKVVEQGYAVSIAERDAESAAIACPVFGVGRVLSGTISLGIPRYRFNKKVQNDYLPRVLDAATELTHALGGDLPSSGAATSQADSLGALQA
ncbi:bacterial transcriptional regulator family protein [Ralstonia insidiosa]|uniref:Bacterial transcriptional regulator family protein n=1 Tax=Ralstonia insidiosa TaxID=190721 RepID=A0AAC9BGY6_9RALS|nr:MULTISPECIES: IclR family transcriptional regulator [Ralstonia]ANH74011.1 bacterial transcriptional regulator family protein [Ralstonia insidiosa]EPX95415.1 IclR family transcriptional regulator [Ralstonia sp. AU12-08]MBY4708047.1 IclR family transcriptional regulator [Ralstonia insidiosa]GAQ28672.1 iclR family transcriptional regulator [Ralstonia sp. NT80]